MPSSEPSVGLVLSGGGVRGAYEVGVLAGVVEALRLTEQDRAPFSVFAGTSVGAINAAFMASNAHYGHMGVGTLMEIWRHLAVDSHLRVTARTRQGDAAGPQGGMLGRSFIDPRPLELLVRRAVSWDRLDENLQRGVVSALLVAAFNVGSGRTNIFTQLAPGVSFVPSRDPRRRPRFGRITADHVLASAAIPFLFPARKIGSHYYCDGGVRFNTPMSSAIRAGAEKLVVISLQAAPGPDEEDELEDYPSTPLLAGKLLNALLLDPFQYDLEILARFNRLVEVLEETLTPEEMQRVQEVLTELRGTGYRRLEPLVFMPSVDIGKLAGEHLREHLGSWKLSRIPRFLLRRASQQDATWEADWAAYLLFDGSFAGQLIELGLADSRARAEEVRAFFEAAPGDEARAPESIAAIRARA